MPHLIDELFIMHGEDPEIILTTKEKYTLWYFGMMVKLFCISDKNKYIDEANSKLC